MNYNSRHIPYPLRWDDAPVDISFIFENEKPAGRHGFLTVNKDKFLFEDGTEARFWGTNFNSGANFPSQTHSEKVARRLAKFGVNIVRFHQMDAEWSAPNIFQYEKGRNKKNTLELDPQSMDRLDYLVYCLKKEGIYVYLDLLTYRRFKSGDGFEMANKLPEAAKPYSIYNKRLIELQKKFNHDLWTHKNPYTGLAYKDDPVFALCCITNENSFFYYKPVELEPYRKELENLYIKWSEEKGVKPTEEVIDFSSTEELMVSFLSEVEKKYCREMTDHLRGVGVRIPITGSNEQNNPAALLSQMATDFLDNHAYWYDWKWSGKCRKMFNDSMTANVVNMINKLSCSRVFGKPFFVSEWDQPWPNVWRAESPLFMAAAGALQGWSGFSIHTYRYDTLENVDMIGRQITSDALGSVYHRGGIFDTFNDPAKFGLFYHAALITRRGDVSQALKSFEVAINDLTVKFPHGGTLEEYMENIPAAVGLPEIHRTGIKVGIYSHGAGEIPYDKLYADMEKGEVKSDTGELYRNWNKRAGIIDTPMTKAAYGFIGEQENILMNGLSLKVKNDFAVVAMSSLSDKPLEESDNILLTTVGRADNYDSSYGEDHTIQLNAGKAPIMIEVIEAEVEIVIKTDNLIVWSVNPDGFLIGAIPSEYKDGKLKFTVGNEFSSMYYLIQQQ